MLARLTWALSTCPLTMSRKTLGLAVAMVQHLGGARCNQETPGFPWKQTACREGHSSSKWLVRDGDDVRVVPREAWRPGPRGGAWGRRGFQGHAPSRSQPLLRRGLWGAVLRGSTPLGDWSP